MRYGINVESHGNGSDGRIEVFVSLADDTRTAAHFVAKTLEVRGEVQYPKGFSSNYTRGERWRLLYPSTEKKGVLSSLDFCNRFDILIVGQEDEARRLQGYFEKVLKCDTDVALNRRAISRFLDEKEYNLIVFTAGNHIIWNDTMRLA